MARIKIANKQPMDSDAQLAKTQTGRGNVHGIQMSGGAKMIRGFDWGWKCPQGIVWEVKCMANVRGKLCGGEFSEGNCSGELSVGNVQGNIWISMQDYKSLRAVVRICVTLVDTHRYANRRF